MLEEKTEFNLRSNPINPRRIENNKTILKGLPLFVSKPTAIGFRRKQFRYEIFLLTSSFK